MVATLDRASLNMTWEPPEAINQNGPITVYLITYERIEQPLVIMSGVTNGTEYVISGLIPFVTYLVQVAARNVNGTGLFSSTVMQVSGQDGKYKFNKTTLTYKVPCVNLLSLANYGRTP